MEENKKERNEDFYAVVSAIARFIETADSDADFSAPMRDAANATKEA